MEDVEDQTDTLSTFVKQNSNGGTKKAISNGRYDHDGNTIEEMED